MRPDIARRSCTRPSGPTEDRLTQVILHVDDDPDIRAVVAKVLADEGFQVNSLATVGEAMESLETSQPDLILLDVMVEEQDSGLNAYDLLAEKYPAIPKILLTSLGEMILPYFSDRKKAVTILEKPILPERLVHTVRTRLKQ